MQGEIVSLAEIVAIALGALALLIALIALYQSNDRR
jgi:hypothetical protein